MVAATWDRASTIAETSFGFSRMPRACVGFPAGLPPIVHGVVIAETLRSVDLHSAAANLPLEYAGTPVTYLSIDDFLNLAMQLPTVPELYTYLAVRNALPESVECGLPMLRTESACQCSGSHVVLQWARRRDNRPCTSGLSRSRSHRLRHQRGAGRQHCYSRCNDGERRPASQHGLPNQRASALARTLRGDSSRQCCCPLQSHQRACSVSAKTEITVSIRPSEHDQAGCRPASTGWGHNHGGKASPRSRCGWLYFVDNRGAYACVVRDCVCSSHLRRRQP